MRWTLPVPAEVRTGASLEATFLVTRELAALTNDYSISELTVVGCLSSCPAKIPPHQNITRGTRTKILVPGFIAKLPSIRLGAEGRMRHSKDIFSDCRRG